MTRRPLKIIIVSLFSLGFAWIIFSWFAFVFIPTVDNPRGIEYTVREGASIRSVIDDLHSLSIINNPLFFKLFVRIEGVSHELKAGEYLFPKGATAQKILHQIITGTGMVYHSFMIVPGWNFKDLRTALLMDPYLNHTIQTLTDEQIMDKLGHSKLKPEGEFYPDTYFFVAGTDDIVILKRAFKVMVKKLDKVWQHREPGLPFKTPYEALIAASIIEKEFYYKEELPKIAGVLVNRLNRGMLLQFDPTVIYGVGEAFDGKITRTNLLSSNPYNTYVHKGLPPTPIAMPSMSSIQAVLHPMKHDYYYFVAEGGNHRFSTNLTEHYEAVKKAKNPHWFFNYSLTHQYLLKLFSKKVYTLN